MLEKGRYYGKSKGDTLTGSQKRGSVKTNNLTKGSVYRLVGQKAKMGQKILGVMDKEQLKEGTTVCC